MDARAYLSALIACESITPDDAGCQALMMGWLTELGFQCRRFDNLPVHNFFARLGNKGPLLVFAGHTDVVPIGDLGKWQSNPFELVEKNGQGFGRGVADMKGSLAAMMVMAKRFTELHPDFTGSLGFLITSGEEGDLYDKGTPHVMAELQKLGIKIDYCIVGEPSSTTSVGDVVKIGRRGSLSGKLILQGKQGHVAYPHLAENPIHKISSALRELIDMHWDNGNDYFPPTSFQITHIQSGGQAGNIIPGELEMTFNFRYSTEQTADKLKRKVHECIEGFDLQATIDWRLSGEPFLTTQGHLLDATVQSITELREQPPELSTSGGTSDGRFIAPYGVEVIELGLVNKTIHQVNECIAMDDLTLLGHLYYDIAKRLLI